MKSHYSDKMFHYFDTMPSYNGCTLGIMIGYQNLVIIYETIITQMKKTKYSIKSYLKVIIPNNQMRQLWRSIHILMHICQCARKFTVVLLSAH